MSTAHDIATDVAVIGFGPTGGVLATLLAKRGWRVAAFDRSVDVVHHPRAVYFDAEVMRVFQHAGIADSLADAVVPVEGMHFLNDDGRIIFRFDADPGPGPLGWRQGYMFHQPSLERTLRTAAATMPRVRMFLGHEVTSIDDGNDGAVVTAAGPAGAIAVSARYVVGCCGARSITRDTIGGGMQDYQFNQTWLVLDILLEREIDLPRTTVQYCETARPSTYVMTPGRRRRFEFMMMPGETPELLLNPSMQQQLLSRWLAPGDYSIERAATYEFHGLVAEQWRRGHLLIAGDAAHQMPPFLGQGMCAGIRDAANLEWKLDLVLRGIARDSLLDTYASERAPNVRLVVEDDIKLGALIQTTSVEGAKMRDAIALRDGTPTTLAPKWYPIGDGLSAPDAPARLPFPQPQLSGGRLHDPVIGRGFAIVGDLQLPERFALFSPVQVPAPHPAIRNWLKANHAAAAIVRPDAIVLGTASSSSELDQVLDRLLSHAI